MMQRDDRKQNSIGVLLFSAGGQQYALDIALVRAVIPVLETRTLPGVPDYVLGVLSYHGDIVPVIDVSRMMCGVAAKIYYSTRIALVDYSLRKGGSKLVGLMLEEAIQAIREIAVEWQPAGIATPEAPYLGGIAMQSEQSVQLIKVQELLSGDVQALLFAD